MSPDDRRLQFDARRQFAAAPVSFESRDVIERYLDRLNATASQASRRILRWGQEPHDSLRVAALACAGAEQSFMGEAALTFDLEVCGQRQLPASAPYSVALVLHGRMEIDLSHGRCVVEPGEGVIIDTADVERTLVAAGSHFVEFSFAKHSLLRLGAELRPGDPDGAPRFQPLLQGPLAKRVLAMAGLAGSALHAARDAASATVMHKRWMDMICLTLLEEQAMNERLAGRRGPVAQPARVRRALDFIDANAHRAIELPDMAQAASLSTSALLRQFQAHLGRSPGAVLRQVKLDRACAELRRGDCGAIKNVAQRWGFQSASRFTQAYRQRFGERPSDSLCAPG